MSKISGHNLGNPFLVQVMRAIQKSRPFNTEKSIATTDTLAFSEGLTAQVFFPTNGCTWNSCTMCDCGVSSQVTTSHMLEAVKSGLARFSETEVENLILYPSGNFLDPVEVSYEAQEKILQLVSATSVKRLFTEVRAESVLEEDFQRIKNNLAQDFVMMIGLESSNDWILRYVVNKGSNIKVFEDAAKRIHANKMSAYANISLGNIFLSPLEAIEDAVRSSVWALSHGADKVILFPLAIRPHTLSELLNDSGRHSPPSLWSLVEVIEQLGPELAPRVLITAYRNNLNIPMKEMPGTCSRCHEDVISLLDDYFGTQSWDKIMQLSAYPCDCHERWRQSLTVPEEPLLQRVIESYDWLAQELRIERFWKKRREALVAEMSAEYRVL